MLWEELDQMVPVQVVPHQTASEEAIQSVQVLDQMAPVRVQHQMAPEASLERMQLGVLDQVAPVRAQHQMAPEEVVQWIPLEALHQMAPVVL